MPSKRSREQGTTSVEYAIMLVLITLAVAAFGSGFGVINGTFSRVVSILSSGA
jgi:Flp pilus assembly pilin Flp